MKMILMAVVVMVMGMVVVVVRMMVMVMVMMMMVVVYDNDLSSFSQNGAVVAGAARGFAAVVSCLDSDSTIFCWTLPRRKQIHAVQKVLKAEPATKAQPARKAQPVTKAQPATTKAR